MQNIDSLVQRLGCLSEWGWQSHNKLSFLKKKNLLFSRLFLQVSDTLRFEAPRRLRKLNIHVHHILAVMTGKLLTHL